MGHGDTTGAHLADARLAVAELLGDAGGRQVAVEPATRCSDCAKAPEDQLECCSSHLGPDPTSLVGSPDPRARLDCSRIRKIGARNALRPDERAGFPHEEVNPPCLRPPGGHEPSVVGAEIVGKAGFADLIRPCDREGHLRGRMDPTSCEAPQLVDLLWRAEPELQSWRPQPHAEKRRKVDHSSNPSGWPRLESSAMSRRKNSAVVQSVTTRSFRLSSGSA